MHPLYRRANELSQIAIGAAIEVHKLKGPGLIESIYSRCMMREFELRGIGVERERIVRVEYKGVTFEEPLRLDMLVENSLILEFKVIDTVLPIHKAQLLSYMRLMDIPLGLLINFNELLLKRGVGRVILHGADDEGVDF